MIKRVIGPVLALSMLMLCPENVRAKTLALNKTWLQRKLQVVRQYDISAVPGQPTVAMLPALLSFVGQTNWQHIKSSRFEFSENPDSTVMISDNLGMPRRNYEMKWKAPKSGKISVKQTMEVELTWIGMLFTTAKLPYGAAVMKRYAKSLGEDEEQGVEPGNPEVGKVCRGMMGNDNSAEDLVEQVCDWINDNIQFTKGKRSVGEALGQRKGSCTPMSKVACSMLRYMGIPCEVVDAKFIASENGHTFIEVYYPDAGWIFYDLSNWNRGFKSLDCLMTVGWAFRSGPEGKLEWTDGNFCKEEDLELYSEDSETGSKIIRRSPRKVDVLGAQVSSAKAPASARSRHKSIREIILNE